jgi:carboxypeptidase T
MFMRLRLIGLFVAVVCILAVAAPPVLAAASGPPPGGDHWVVRAAFTDRDQVNKLAAYTEPWEVHYDQGWLIVDVDREGWQQLLDLGFVVEVDAVRTEEALRPRVRLEGQGTDSIPGFPCYRTVEETFASAQALVTAHPNLASWIDIGDSWEKQSGTSTGYDIMVLKLTNSAIPGPKPKLLINSTIHAREYTTAELVTQFGEYLVNQYGINADATWMLDYHEIHLVLQSNPDGRKKAETGILWRKNTNPIICGVNNNRGIDLNRNFAPPAPNQWNCCGGSSGNACAETYHGPSPASEPETQAVQSYALSIFPDYGDPGNGNPPPADAAGLFIDIHSYSQLVLWPWGGTTTQAPNATQLQTLGRKFAYFNNYLPEQSIYLYATDGTTIDYTYGTLGVSAYTFELGTNFFQDCGTFTGTILPNNMQALIYAARTTRAPYMLPAGPESLSVATMPSGTVNSGAPLVVNATENDTRFSNVNGSEPVQNIAAAEVYVDTPPWAPGATPVAMAPVDGLFNTPIEAVTATVSTVGWSLGRHILFVCGRDAANNWGPVGAVFIDVVVPVGLQGFVVE